MLKHTNLTFSVTSIVPANNVDITFKEEIEPISIWSNHHLLVTKRIRVAHNHSWLAQVFLTLVLQQKLVALNVGVVNLDFFLLGAWEEHTVQVIVVRALDVELLPIEGFLQYYGGLIVTPE